MPLLMNGRIFTTRKRSWVWIAGRLGPGQTRNLGESFQALTPNPVTILPKTRVHPSDLVRHSNAVSIDRVSKV